MLVLLKKNFDGVTLDAIIFTARTTSPMTAEPSLVISFFREQIYAYCAASVLLLFLLYPLKVKTKLTLFRKRIFPLSNTALFSIALFMLTAASVHISFNLQIPRYISNKCLATAIYDDYYISPENVRLKFPQTKRNLILIYMESMEATYLTFAQGGGRTYCIIPNLAQLAEENINFSQSSKIGGPESLSGTSWTIAAMFGSLAGIPLSVPIERNCYSGLGTFAPGAFTLGDILRKEGYNLYFVTGADASFAGTKDFFTYHGDFTIKDVFDAEKEGLITREQWTWWGLDDKTVYRYAQQELLKLAHCDAPFCFIMATLDTHAVGGWKCSLCQSEFKHQIENVIACSDRQIADFLAWVKKQPFYNNTTIVIMGDHLSMEPEYFKDIPNDYSRHPYNVFINSSVETKFSKNRIFTTLDYYPTILASLGVEIDGERLGMGTNLFSGEKTLPETLGIEKVKSELSKTSTFYDNKILYGDT